MQFDLFAPRPAQPAPLIIPEAAPLASRDFAQIPGHETAKRVLEIALVGDHLALLVGTDTADIAALQAATYEAADALGIPQPQIPWAALGDDEGHAADMRGDLCPDPRADLGPHGDSTAELVKRIAAARVIRSEWEAQNEDDMDPLAARLLAQALAAWGREGDDKFRCRILSVARSIAALAIVNHARTGAAGTMARKTIGTGATAYTLGRVHIAEALAYGRTPEPRQ